MGLQTKKIKYAEHWVEIELNEICDKITDGTHHTPTYLPKGVAFISVKDINDNKVDFTKCKYISIEQHKELIQRCNPEKDNLLVTKSGTIGRMAIVPEKTEFSLFVSVALIKNKPHFITTKFLKFYLENFFNSISIDQDIKGGLLKNFHLEDIRLTLVPIVSLSEQNRIVVKLEELFSSLDKGIENLKLAQAQLKIYRHAVLKQAFEGVFTKNWRKKNRCELNGLLNKIKKQKEDAISAKHIKKDNYFENNDVKNIIYNVPENWLQLPWKTITSNNKYAMKRGPFGSALKKEFFIDKGYTVYEQGHAINDDPYRDRYFINDDKYNELKAFAVKPGDLIISCSGVTLGRICLLPNDCKPGIINQALLKIDLDENIILKKFFILMFRSETFQRKIFQKSLGTAMSNMVGMEELKELVIPIPSIKEQEQIIQEAESRLSVCDKIEESITISLLQAEALRQSILKKAFEGKLVPQDPTDEPASVLLARIKAEIEKKEKVKRNKKN